MSIVQLSDIHLSGYMPRGQVRRAVEMANELGADLAVVTGDFITSASDPLPDCIDEIVSFVRRWEFGAATAITKSMLRLKTLRSPFSPRPE